MFQPNARFWIYWNQNWVKLTLKPTQSVSLNDGRTTCEGFVDHNEVYTHEGDRVGCSITTISKDCDGVFHHYWDGFCELDSLKENPEDENGPARPYWTKESQSQRDLFAERCGY